MRAGDTVDTRRDFITRTATVALATGLAGPAALAQVEGYPNRPIRFFCGFPPGGVADIVARVIAQPLSTRLGQSVVVDNRAGAGGVIAVYFNDTAPPEIYT